VYPRLKPEAKRGVRERRGDPMISCDGVLFWEGPLMHPSAGVVRLFFLFSLLLLCSPPVLVLVVVFLLERSVAVVYPVYLVSLVALVLLVLCVAIVVVPVVVAGAYVVAVVEIVVIVVVVGVAAVVIVVAAVVFVVGYFVVACCLVGKNEGGLFVADVPPLYVDVPSPLVVLLSSEYPARYPHPFHMPALSAAPLALSAYVLATYYTCADVAVRRVVRPPEERRNLLVFRVRVRWGAFSDSVSPRTCEFLFLYYQ